MRKVGADIVRKGKERDTIERLDYNEMKDNITSAVRVRELIQKKPGNREMRSKKSGRARERKVGPGEEIKARDRSDEGKPN